MHAVCHGGTDLRQFSTRRTLLAISIAISLCFAAFIAFFFNRNMIGLLKEREKDVVQIHQEQTVSLLLRDCDNLSFSLRDWASKASTYRFVDESLPSEKRALMQTNPIFLLRLDYAAIIAKNGFASERYFDHERNEELETAPYAEEIGMIARWLHRKVQSRYDAVGLKGDVFGALSHTQYSGFTGIGTEVYYLTAVPIMTPNNDRSSNGTMIFGRRITDRDLGPSPLVGNPDEKAARTTVFAIPPEVLQYRGVEEVGYSDSNRNIVMESIVPSLDDNVVVLRTSQPRSMYRVGVRAVSALSVLVFVSSCLLSLLLIAIMDLWLIRPILTLSKKMSELGYEHFSLELPSFRGRELNILSLSVKGLLRKADNHRKRIEEQNQRLSLQNELLNTIANYDTHTKLPNGNRLKAVLTDRISTAREMSHFVALIYVDIANFLLVRDACGQSTSDLMLVAVADRLRATFGTSEESVAACLGRESFALVVTADDMDQIGFASAKLMTLFAEPFVVGDNEITVKASVGIAVAPGDGETFDGLHACANIALNKARAEGESSSVFFEPCQLEAAIGKFNRIADMKRGLERGEFYVVFQPKVDMKTNLITSSEALVRWRSNSGPVPPSLFIPDACESGLIVPLSWEILRQSFASNKRFAARLDNAFSVGINVPNNVLLHRDFIPILTELLDEAEMPATSLNVELTEDVLVNDMNKCNMRMHELQQMGAQISIDDFGTGYSSLQYLSKMPFDWMKIDKTFVDGLPHKQEETAIIRASVGIARGLGMKVVLEGVETSEQWSKIVEQDYCDQIQGYIVSKPLEEGPFIRFVLEWNTRVRERSELQLCRT